MGAPPAGELSLTAEVVDIDGKVPGKSSITFFRELVEGEVAKRGDVRDPATGKSWRGVEGAATGGSMTAEGLAAGTYRVVAHRGHHEATPVGTSEPIVLDGSQGETKVTVRLIDGRSILVRAVDATTGAPAPGVSIQLKGENWPLVAATRRPRERDDFVTFDHVPVGQYVLTASSVVHDPSELQYTLDAPVAVELGEKNLEVTLRLRASRLSEEEIASRWPWVATGRVGDERGNPIVGATVRAATGYGSLGVGGSTTTDAEGRYWLRFAEGMHSNDPVSLQAALFFASKPGMSEKNLNRQGNLMMARREPPLDRTTAGKTVVLPGSPVGIDFVLVPAARLDVELIDPNGEAFVPQSLEAVGSILPPGSNVLASAKPEFNGRYHFADVPTEQRWWFSARVSRRESLRSPAFTLSEQGEAQLRLRVVESGPSGRRALVFEEVEPATIQVDP
jgi:hypothetical protein